MAESAHVAGRPVVMSALDDAELVRAGVVAVTAVALVYAVTPSSWTVLRTLVLLPAAGAFAVGCVLIGVHRYRPVASRAWLLIAGGLGLFTVGYVVSGIYEVTAGEDPYPSLAEVFYLAAYPVFAAGLVVAVKVRQTQGLDPVAGIDAGIIAGAGGLLAWVYLARPALASGDLSTAAALTTLVYVLGDLLLLGMALRFLMVSDWRRRWSLCALTLGFAGTLAGDLAYTTWVVHGAPPVRFWEVALLVGTLAMGVAALHPTMRALTEEDADPVPPPTGRRLVTIAAVSLIPPALLAVRELRDQPLYLVANLVVWVALILLIAARFARGARLSEQEAEREAALSRYAADMLAAGDQEQILTVARGALRTMSDGGDGDAYLVPSGQQAPSDRPVRASFPVVVRGEELGAVVATGPPMAARRWRGSLRVIADQLSMALERDRLLAVEREAAESLAQQNERLRELDAMKDTFVSSVSHELRTPLTSMVGFLEILREGELGELTEEQSHALDIIDRNGHRLEHLIGDILVAARFDSGRMRFDMGPVDLAELATRQVESITAVASAQGTDVRLAAEPGLPPLWGDELRLAQVIDNLLSNAVKFTPDGEVTVAVRRHGDDRVALEVQDTGVGMPADELDKVFDRFYRASTAGVTVGTGLGLSIARSIVEEHGGTIGVTSEVGVGTTFRVELPLPTDPVATADDRHEVTT